MRARENAGNRGFYSIRLNAKRGVLAGQAVSTITDKAGNQRAWLPDLAGSPEGLELRNQGDGEAKVLADIPGGEVWLYSGQSIMLRSTTAQPTGWEVAIRNQLFVDRRPLFCSHLRVCAHSRQKEIPVTSSPSRASHPFHLAFGRRRCNSGNGLPLRLVPFDYFKFRLPAQSRARPALRI